MTTETPKGGRVVLYLPGNLFHGNVPPEARMDYLVNIRTWLQVLRDAGFPVVTSFQRVDLDLMGLTEADFEGIELLGGMYNHALPTLFEKHPGLGNHTKWLLKNGVQGNVPGMFFPEFNIPRTDIIGREPMIIPVAPSALSFLYSICETGDISPDLPISKYEAVRFREHTVVPMHLACQKPFFEWQRTQTHAALGAFLDELVEIRTNGKGIKILFLDLEACLVGSRHGLSVWRRLFAAIRETGLSDMFVPFAQAAEYWRSVAFKPEESTSSLVARDLGKWMGLDPQVEYTDRVKYLPAPMTDADHKLMALATTSDITAAMDRKVRGSMTFDADAGTKITIGYDQTIIDIGFAAVEAIRTGKPLQIRTNNSAGARFARIVENYINRAFGD